MAEIVAPNLKARLPAAGSAQQAQVSAADWDGGMNPGSCQPGIGINTGDYSPKASDWAEIEIAPAESQWLGGVDGNLSVPGNVSIPLVEPVDGNDTFAFVQADAETAPDAVLDAVTGAVNRTGKTVPAAAWCWGTVPVV